MNIGVGHFLPIMDPKWIWWKYLISLSILLFFCHGHSFTETGIGYQFLSSFQEFQVTKLSLVPQLSLLGISTLPLGSPIRLCLMISTIKIWITQLFKLSDPVERGDNQVLEWQKSACWQNTSTCYLESFKFGSNYPCCNAVYHSRCVSYHLGYITMVSSLCVILRTNVYHIEM